MAELDPPAPRPETVPTLAPPLWLIFAFTITGVLANSVLTPNIPDVLEDLGQPSSRAGLLVAATPLPGIVMAPIIGILADRYGRRQVLIPCLIVFGIGGLASAAAPTFLALLFTRFAQGAGGAGLINLAVVLIGDHWAGIDRTRIIGWNSAVLTVCLALIPSIAGVIGDLVTWRLALAISGIALPLAAVGWLRLPADRPGATTTIADQLRGAVTVLRQPAVLVIMLTGVVLFTVIFGVFLTALPVHLDERFGLSAGPRGLILSTFAIGATIASFNLGRMRARWSARTMLVGSSVVIAITAAALGLAPTVALIVVAAVAYGLGDGTAIPALQDLVTAAAPTEQRASVMAAWVSGIRMGQTIGPLGAAALFAATSTRTTMLVGAGVFAALALVMTVAPLPDDRAADA